MGGKVVWCSQHKAGLRFDGYAGIAQWLPSTNGAQIDTDREVELAKAERRAGLLPSSVAPIPSSTMLAADLKAMAIPLNHLSDDLASDPAVVSKYMTQLQILKIAGLALTGCANGLSR